MRTLILALALLGAASTAQASELTPAACPVEVAKDEKIDCFALTVPENRHKADSRTISLPVMIFRARTSTPAPDPVIFLPGGPGGSATRLKSGNDLPFAEARDYILLEPRGAKYAAPALECPQINALQGEISAGHHRHDADAVLTQAAADCRADLVAKGIDLDGYTSAETAQDIEDLRLALGLAQWNVLGHSYGTRLALTYVRDHPEGIRSVILDSVLPPQVNFDEDATANLIGALDLVFKGCKETPACHDRYPSLIGDFFELLKTAENGQLTGMPEIMGSDGKPVTVGAARVTAGLYNALHDPGMIGQIPRIIEDAHAGKPEALAELIKGDQGPSGFTWGLRLSVWCAEEMPFEDARTVENQTAPWWQFGGLDERTASPAMCKAWNVKAADAKENLPVSGTMPLLVLAGEYDPDTPPDWGKAVTRFFPKSTYVLMTGKSHGAGFNRCGGKLEMAFLADPEAPLDQACVVELPKVDFTPGS